MIKNFTNIVSSDEICPIYGEQISEEEVIKENFM